MEDIAHLRFLRTKFFRQADAQLRAHGNGDLGHWGWGRRRGIGNGVSAAALRNSRAQAVIRAVVVAGVLRARSLTIRSASRSCARRRLGRCRSRHLSSLGRRRLRIGLHPGQVRRGHNQVVHHGLHALHLGRVCGSGGARGIARDRARERYHAVSGSHAQLFVRKTGVAIDFILHIGRDLLVCPTTHSQARATHGDQRQGNDTDPKVSPHKSLLLYVVACVLIRCRVAGIYCIAT